MLFPHHVVIKRGVAVPTRLVVVTINSTYEPNSWNIWTLNQPLGARGILTSKKSKSSQHQKSNQLFCHQQYYQVDALESIPRPKELGPWNDGGKKKLVREKENTPRNQRRQTTDTPPSRGKKILPQRTSANSTSNRHLLPAFLAAGPRLVVVAQDMRYGSVGVLVRGKFFGRNILAREARALLTQVAKSQDEVQSIPVLEEKKSYPLRAIRHISLALCHSWSWAGGGLASE